MDRMESCDFTGGTDFNCFDLPDANNTLPTQEVENDNMDLDFSTFQRNSSSGEPFYNNVPPTVEEICYPTRRCSGAETAVSEAYPPRYPKLPAPDPFSFLLSKSRARSGRRDKDEKTEKSFPNESCNHDEHTGSRHFFLQFDPKDSSILATRSDKCYVAEHERCVDFWNFVDETVELQNLIKDGKFFHKVPPKDVRCRQIIKQSLPWRTSDASDQEKIIRKGARSKGKSVLQLQSGPKYTPEMEALRQRNLAIHAEEKKRREKLRSLQSNLHEKHMPKPKNPDDSLWTSLADCSNPLPVEVLAEMEVYDEISQNPVQINCKSRVKPCKEADSGGGGDGYKAQQKMPIKVEGSISE